MGPTPVLALWTGRNEGDQSRIGLASAPPPPVPESLSLRRMRQVHGSKVLIADHGDQNHRSGFGPPLEPWCAGEDGEPPEADAVLTASSGICLAVLSADCTTVALSSDAGIYGAVHVGWRGLLAGVVEAALGAIRSFGARAVYAGLGPAIHPCCYEFDSPELQALQDRYGNEVRSLTRSGTPALDLPGAVKKALRGAGAEIALDAGACTACAPERFYSYRARGEPERQGLFVWLDGISS